MFGNAYLGSEIVNKSKQVISNNSQGGGFVMEEGQCLVGRRDPKGTSGHWPSSAPLPRQ